MLLLLGPVVAGATLGLPSSNIWAFREQRSPYLDQQTSLNPEGLKLGERSFRSVFLAEAEPRRVARVDFVPVCG